MHKMQEALNILNALNNREKAVGIWILLALFLYLKKVDFRKSLWGLIKSFFQLGLVKMNTAMLLYSVAMVWIFWKIGLWDVSLLKETLYWMGSAFVMLMNANKAYEEEGFFKKKIYGLLALTVFVEFLVGLHPYGLIIEVILVPIAFFFVLLYTMADVKGEEFRPAKSFTGVILFMVFIAYSGNSIVYLVSYWGQISVLAMAREMVFPLLLTLLYLPFIYTMALYMLYETTFTRLSFYNAERKLGWRIRVEVFRICRANLFKLREFSKKFRIIWGTEDSEVLRQLRQIRLDI